MPRKKDILWNPQEGLSDKKFLDWYSKNTLEGKRGIPHIDPNMDYDFYSYYKNTSKRKLSNPKNHFPDTYKYPNHESFSNESLYSTPEQPGGQWLGNQYNPNGQFKYGYGGPGDPPKKKEERITSNIGFTPAEDDSSIENFFEMIDPTGILSWDDAEAAYNNPNLSPSDKTFEYLGAIPLLGTAAKAIKGGKLLYGALNAEGFLNDEMQKKAYGGPVKRDPILVYDKNDPRLKAYNDSLSSYFNNIKFNNKGLELLEQSNNRQQFNDKLYNLDLKYPINTKIASQKNDLTKAPILGFKRFNDGDSITFVKEYDFKKPEQPVKYVESRIPHDYTPIKSKEANFDNTEKGLMQSQSMQINPKYRPVYSHHPNDVKNYGSQGKITHYAERDERTGNWRPLKETPSDLYIPQPMKQQKFLLGGALYGAAKAFGANDKTANILGAAGGGAEMFFNPLSGGADVAKYGASFLNNAGVITPQAANAVNAVSSVGNMASKYMPAMMAYGGSRQQLYAFGGDMFNEYNGPSHNEGGIDLNPVAEVEGGENEYKGYIHSNRVKYNKQRTYAQEAKRIFNKYKDRLTDKLSLDSLDREMKSLQAHQESNPEILKGREKIQKEFAYGGKKYGYGDPIKPIAYKGMRNYKGEEVPLNLPPSYYNPYGIEDPNGRILRNPNGLFTTGPLSGEPFSYPGPNGKLLENEIDPLNFDSATFKSFNPSYPNPYSQSNLPVNVNSDIPTNLNYPQNNNTLPAIKTNKQNVSDLPREYPWQKVIDGYANNSANNPYSFIPTTQQPVQQSVQQSQQPVVDFKQVYADPNDPTRRNMYSQQTPNNQPYAGEQISYNQLPFNANSGVYSDQNGNTYGMPKALDNQLPDTNIPISGALMNSIGPASQLIGTLVKGADKTRFDRISPNYVDYDPAVNLLRSTAAGATGNMRAGVVNNARSSGQLLSNLTAGNVAIQGNLNRSIADLKMNEANQNVQIGNQTKTANAQIQMQEQIANEQNKAAYRQAIYGSLTDLGNIGAGYKRDNAFLDAQTLQNQRTLNMLAGLPARYTIDQYGNIITK
jgi:hypothetical protein